MRIQIRVVVNIGIRRPREESVLEIARHALHTSPVGPWRALTSGVMPNSLTHGVEKTGGDRQVSGEAGVSVGEVLRRLGREPRKYLLARWNWKSAVLSSVFRAAIFFVANLTAGVSAAVAAMSTEFIFGGTVSGFYGALTEAFCDAEPAWAAAVSVLVLLPAANHVMEFVVHWLRGTAEFGAKHHGVGGVHGAFDAVQSLRDAARGAGGGPWTPIIRRRLATNAANCF